MEKKRLIWVFIAIGAFLFILGGIYVTKLVIKDIQLSKAERTIEKAKARYDECVIVMAKSHDEAEEARAKKAELLGTGFQMLLQEQKLGAERTLTGPNQTNN